VLQCHRHCNLFVVVAHTSAEVTGLGPDKGGPDSHFKLGKVSNEIDEQQAADVHYSLEVAHCLEVRCEHELPVLNRRLGPVCHSGCSVDLNPLPAHSQHRVQSIKTPLVGFVVEDTHGITGHDLRFVARLASSRCLEDLLRTH
jgi:hypothetical protein